MTEKYGRIRVAHVVVIYWVNTIHMASNTQSDQAMHPHIFSHQVFSVP